MAAVTPTPCLKRGQVYTRYVHGGHAVDADWSARIAREFRREPLTPARAISLAGIALEENRKDDAERLIAIAFELYDLAFAEALKRDH